MDARNVSIVKAREGVLFSGEKVLLSTVSSCAGRIHTEKKAPGVIAPFLFTIFRTLQAFCLNLGSIFEPDKITIGKTNGLICEG